MYSWSGHSASVTCVAIRAGDSGNITEPELVVTGSSDKTVRVWDIRETENNLHRNKFVFSGHLRKVSSISIPYWYMQIWIQEEKILLDLEYKEHETKLNKFLAGPRLTFRFNINTRIKVFPMSRWPGPTWRQSWWSPAARTPPSGCGAWSRAGRSGSSTTSSTSRCGPVTQWHRVTATPYISAHVGVGGPDRNLGPLQLHVPGVALRLPGARAAPPHPQHQPSDGGASGPSAAHLHQRRRHPGHHRRGRHHRVRGQHARQRPCGRPGHHPGMSWCHDVMYSKLISVTL